MNFSKNEITVLLLGIAAMLFAARLFGEIFRRLRLPSMTGEIVAGIIIGPTLLGRAAPEFYRWIFPGASRVGIVEEGLAQLSMIFLLFIAGMEVNLSSALYQGRTVLRVSFLTILIPFIFGAATAWFAPSLFGAQRNTILTLFIGIAMSITALPIVAKILMEQKLIQTDFGMLVLASALLNDLAGWILFSIIIHMMNTGGVDAVSLLITAVLTVSTSVVIITAGRYIINRSLPWIQAKTEWPGGVISITIILGLLFSALTEVLGAHAIFGAFLAGIAVGDSPHFTRHTRDIIAQFVNNFFTPLFFVSIGMMTDFAVNIDIVLVLVLLALTYAGKMSGAFLGGYFSGMERRESLAVGGAMSATGTMQIILALIAMNYRLIGRDIFASLVFVAVFTSLVGSPLMRLFLKSKKTMNLLDFTEKRLFISSLASRNREGAIAELVAKAALKTGVPADFIAEKVIERENLMGTGIGFGIAVPHARMKEITSTVIVTGKSAAGIDFNAPDGKPAHIIFLVLTPYDDPEAQIKALSEISNIFLDESVREQSIRAAGFNEFYTVLKMAYHGREHS